MNESPAKLRMTRSRASAARWLAALGWALSSTLTLADAAGCWRELGFTASNGWAGASSVLRFERLASRDGLLTGGPPTAGSLQPRGATVGKIHVDFRAMTNTGELLTWYDPDAGAVLQSRRLSRGRDSRLKTHRFQADSVWRERREPGAGADASDPDSWTVRTAALIPYPLDGQPRAAVAAPVMLLASAADLVLAGGSAPVEELVFTDTQLYRVRLAASSAEPIEVDFRLSRGEEETRVRGTRQASRVSLSSTLVGASEEDEPFSLLELSGELAIFIDSSSGLPLRVQGSWLRMGTIPAQLTHAKVRPGCAPQ